MANNIKYVWQLTVFFFSNTFHFYCNLFCYLLTYLFTYLFFYFLLCINVVDLLSIKKKKYHRKKRKKLKKNTLFPFTGLDPDSAWTHTFVSSRTEFAVFIENPFLLPVYLLESDLKLAEL